jgi:hypothetical protein
MLLKTNCILIIWSYGNEQIGNINVNEKRDVFMPSFRQKALCKEHVPQLLP